MAASEAAKARSAEIKNRQQEGPTGPPNAAEPYALNSFLSGRQSCGISSAVAPVIQAAVGEEKGATNEIGYPLSQSVALP